MPRSLFIFIAIAIALPLSSFAQSAVPICRSLDKQEALRGDTVTVTGERLGKANIAELMLTAGNNDVKVKVLEQTEESIKFQVAADTKFARYGLLILTAGEQPMYVEQPVKLNVVEKLSPKEEPAPAPPPAEAPSPTPNR